MSRLETKVTDDVTLAAEVIRGGGIVAFPTETVYGLGADALDERAVRKIFEAKGRPADNPLIVHVCDTESISVLVSGMSESARRLMSAFFPGPLTLVLPRSGRVPDVTTAGLDTVAVRMPDHPVALALIRESGRFIAAPSANRSGRPSPTNWEDVFQDLNGRVDAILKGDRTRVGLESTVVDCTGPDPVILRPGSISLEDIQLVCPTATVSGRSEQEHRSPGTRHRHYQPESRVVLVDEGDEITDGADAAYIGITGGEGARVRLLVLDVEAYAHHLFTFFRKCEREGVGTIYCQRVDRSGLGTALMDRLERASASE
jgi:L-threonylcarbamoyladenylate synthase